MCEPESTSNGPQVEAEEVREKGPEFSAARWCEVARAGVLRYDEEIFGNTLDAPVAVLSDPDSDRGFGLRYTSPGFEISYWGEDEYTRRVALVATVAGFKYDRWSDRDITLYEVRGQPLFISETFGGLEHARIRHEELFESLGRSQPAPLTPDSVLQLMRLRDEAREQGRWTGWNSRI